MPVSHTLDRVAVTFDDTHAVADAGLILPATLAQHLGLRALFDAHVDLGSAAAHANVGDKAMTLIHSALADGDSIDDADVLRSGATGVGTRCFGALDVGDLPSEFYVGPRPPARRCLRRRAWVGVGGAAAPETVWR
jgi:hypothetical protein